MKRWHVLTLLGYSLMLCLLAVSSTPGEPWFFKVLRAAAAVAAAHNLVEAGAERERARVNA